MNNNTKDQTTKVVKADVVKADVVKKDVAKKDVSESDITLMDKVSIGAEILSHAANNLVTFLEIYREWKEYKRFENAHELALLEINSQNTRWEMTITKRSNEREKLHNSLKNEIEKTNDINEKIALYQEWSDSINKPFVLKEEINMKTETNNG